MRIVEVTNEWDQEIVIPHNGEMYRIDPGMKKIVPFDAAASLFGHPEARDDAKVKGRRELYDHVRGMWNFYLGWDTEQTWTDIKCPKFSAVDVNSGEPIWFVIQDPDGSKGFNAPQDLTGTDQALLAANLHILQQQVAILTARLMAQPDPNVPQSAVPPEVVEPNEVDVNGPSVTTEPVGTDLPKPAKDDDGKVTKDGPRTVPSK